MTAEKQWADITLSIAIPCYNEELTVIEMIAKVAKQTPLVRQIIVVNDGSTDKTHQKLADLAGAWTNPQISLNIIEQDHNRGKGAAVRKAIEAATEPFFLIQDADLELTPLDYRELCQPIRDGEADVVYGDRFPNGFPETLNILSRTANWIVSTLTNALYKMGIKDQACGYKLVPTSLIRELNLTSNGFEICSEMTAKLGLRRTQVSNVPVLYDPRTFSQGKKIRWKDGILAVYTLLKYRLLSFI